VLLDLEVPERQEIVVQFSLFQYGPMLSATLQSVGLDLIVVAVFVAIESFGPVSCEDLLQLGLVCLESVFVV